MSKLARIQALIRAGRTPEEAKREAEKIEADLAEVYRRNARLVASADGVVSYRD